MSIPSRPLGGMRGLVVAFGDEQGVARLCATRAAALGAHVALAGIGVQTASALRARSVHPETLLLTCANHHRAAFAATVDAAARQLGGFDFVVHATDCAVVDEQGQRDAAELEAYFRLLQISCRSFSELARACAGRMVRNATLVHLDNAQVVGSPLSEDLSLAVHRVFQSIVAYLALELTPLHLRVHALARGVRQASSSSGLARSGGSTESLCTTAMPEQAPAACLVDQWLTMVLASSAHMPALDPSGSRVWAYRAGQGRPNLQLHG